MRVAATASVAAGVVALVSAGGWIVAVSGSDDETGGRAIDLFAFSSIGSAFAAVVVGFAALLGTEARARAFVGLVIGVTMLGLWLYTMIAVAYSS